MLKLEEEFIISVIEDDTDFTPPLNRQLFWNSEDKEFGRFVDCTKFSSKRKAEDAILAIYEEIEDHYSFYHYDEMLITSVYRKTIEY